MVTEDVYIPADPLLEILTIPTFSQLQTQPQTIESTSNETTFDSPNQEHVATESYEFKPHSVPTMETPTQSPPTPLKKIEIHQSHYDSSCHQKSGPR
jgi:hypothetical protein